MTRVIIQPSYGNAAARRHWADTLAQDVPFESEPYVLALTADELQTLKGAHPSGQARFWGATSNHDANMATLATGDVVLFTGRKKVLAVGEVGVSFNSGTFGDVLWDPHPDRGSYNNVYSLLSFQDTDIDYEEVWDLPGFNSGDNFMGLRFLDEAKSRAVIEGLQIDPLSPYQADVAQESAAIVRILTAAGREVDPEGVHTTSTSYERPGGTVVVHRAESLLVQLYRERLSGDRTAKRLLTPVGLTDLHVVGEDWVEIIEAKRNSDHQFVRQALGQLLDYALHSPTPVTRLTALFPDRPADQDIFLLHNYGIDCTYLGDENAFVRADAPQALRVRSWPLWRAQS